MPNFFIRIVEHPSRADKSAVIGINLQERILDGGEKLK